MPVGAGVEHRLEGRGDVVHAGRAAPAGTGEGQVGRVWQEALETGREGGRVGGGHAGRVVAQDAEAQAGWRAPERGCTGARRSGHWGDQVPSPPRVWATQGTDLAGDWAAAWCTRSS